MTTPDTQPDTTDKASKPGAPEGNVNAARHGLRGAGLPAGCGHIQRSTNMFRRSLEHAVFDARGEVNLSDAALINSAYRWERHAQLSQRWLLKDSTNMSAADRLNYSREVARASSERDRCIKLLALPERADTDPWSSLPRGTQTLIEHNAGTA